MLALYLSTLLTDGGGPVVIKPVSLALAKQHLEYEDDDRDDLISQYIDAAQAWVEGYTGLLLTRRAVVSQLDGCSRYYILGAGPDPVIDSLTYLDSDMVEQTVPPADYTLVNGRLHPVTTLPFARYGYVATITAGFTTDIPADLISAQLLIVGHLFANREAVSATGLTEVPLAAKSLCDPHRALRV